MSSAVRFTDSRSRAISAIAWEFVSASVSGDPSAAASAAGISRLPDPSAATTT
jgi:hypothetical protein